MTSRTILASLLLASISTVASTAQSSLVAFRVTDPRRSDCALWTAVEQLARQARLRIGFESTRGCAPGAKSLAAGDTSVTVDAGSPIEALDRLLQLAPEFAWRSIDGIVVVRPNDAWKDPADPLNQSLRRFSATNTNPHFAVHAALESATPSLLMEHIDVNDNRMGLPSSNNVSVEFEGGTLLHALNEIVAGFSGMWQVGFTNHAFHVVLHSFEFESGSIIPGRLKR